MITQFINEFTVSAALTVITSLIDEVCETEPKQKSSTTKKKKKKKSTKKKSHSYSEEMPSALFEDWDTGEESDEEEDDEDDDNDTVIEHLRNFVELMDDLDNCLETAVNEDPDSEAGAMYEKFGNYYRTIVPYVELVNVTYQQNFVSELKNNADKLSRLVSQFIDDFINKMDDDSVNLSSRINNEMDMIMYLVKLRIEEGVGRPSFDSVIITKNDDENSGETQTE